MKLFHHGLTRKATSKGKCANLQRFHTYISLQTSSAKQIHLFFSNMQNTVAWSIIDREHSCVSQSREILEFVQDAGDNSSTLHQKTPWNVYCPPANASTRTGNHINVPHMHFVMKHPAFEARVEQHLAQSGIGPRLDSVLPLHHPMWTANHL